MKYYINKIYLKNFKCIKNENGIIVDFNVNKGLIALGGPNGFGKTTIFDAIEVAFCDKIGRIISINKGNKKVKDHLLIYKNRDNATIGIELKNDENSKVITLIKRIKKSGKNKEDNIDESIDSFWVEDQIELDKINEDSYGNKIEDLKEFLQSKLGINNEYFNSIYYISQDNSKSILKKDLNDRKPLFETLMKIQKETELANKINNLVGEKTNISIQKLITIKRQEIENDIKTLYYVNDNCSEYQPNVTLFGEDSKVEWDAEDFLIKDKEPINELDKLIKFINNYNVFLARMNNEKIERLFEDELIKEFIYVLNSCDYDTKIKYEDNINNRIKFLDFLTYICDALKKIENFSFEDNKIITALMLVNDKLDLKLDIEEIQLSINEVIVQNQKLSKYKAKIKELKDSIEKLNELFLNSVDKENQNSCPLCKSKFDSAEDLQRIIKNNIEELEKIISLDDKRKEKSLKDIFQTVVKEGKEKLKISDLSQYRLSIDNMLKKLRKYLTNKIIKNYIDYFLKENLLNSVIEKIKVNNEDDSTIYIKSLLKLKLIEEEAEYTKDDYNNDIITYQKYIFKLDNKDLFYTNRDEFLINVKNKKKYFINELCLKDSKDKKLINNKIKQLIKMEKLSDELKKLDDIYKKEIKSFKEDVISTIEIPLFIYTGKIIQNYQGGLGVFVRNDNNVDNIVFTPNTEETEHDIINTFSSGQLAGFTIAFLLVINRLYLCKKESENMFNTILIDDPVQTMDDVNIASLVEVLRNQFNLCQIILSTHEDEKINYMRYKFEKFGINTIEYNVKKHFFEN